MLQKLLVQRLLAICVMVINIFNPIVNYSWSSILSKVHILFNSSVVFDGFILHTDNNDFYFLNFPITTFISIFRTHTLVQILSIVNILFHSFVVSHRFILFTQIIIDFNLVQTSSMLCQYGYFLFDDIIILKMRLGYSLTLQQHQKLMLEQCFKTVGTTFLEHII